MRPDPSGRHRAKRTRRDVAREGARAHAGEDVDHTPHTPQFNPVAQIAAILLRAQQQCVVSGVRFGSKAATSLLQGQSRLMDPMKSSASANASSEQAVRALVDDARGCLREVAEAAAEEFRLLQSELTMLQEAMRALIDEPDDSERAYARRWKAKP
jgi:hypothetical protein